MKRSMKEILRETARETLGTAKIMGYVFAGLCALVILVFAIGAAIGFVFEIIPNDAQIAGTVDRDEIVLSYEHGSGGNARYFVISADEEKIELYTAYRKNFLLSFQGRYKASLCAEYDIAAGTAEYSSENVPEFDDEFAASALCCVSQWDHRSGDTVYCGVSAEEPTQEKLPKGAFGLQCEQVEGLYVFIYLIPWDAK